MENTYKNFIGFYSEKMKINKHHNDRRGFYVLDKVLLNLLKSLSDDALNTIEQFYAQEKTGHDVHKAFRQCDITDNPHIDSAIWDAMASGKVDIYWQSLDIFNKYIDKVDKLEDIFWKEADDFSDL